MNKFLCVKNACYSPIACGTFGYCRDRNFDGYPVNEMNNTRRKAESDKVYAEWRGKQPKGARA